jgi:hypothetical protein|tara:strand:+ start:380 stop:754 length:375 start_codon:yes stop_codon:yes gene_type:complete
MKSRYPIVAIATGMILFAMGYGLKVWLGDEFYASELPWLIVFFEASTLLIHFLMTRTGNDNPKRFPAKFMGIQGIKMFVYMLVLVGYSLMLMELALPFVTSFGLLYFVFSVLEVRYVLKDLKTA